MFSVDREVMPSTVCCEHATANLASAGEKRGAFYDGGDRRGSSWSGRRPRFSGVTVNSRASDVVCRFGGEEFAVILPETGLDGGKHFAEKMLQSVRDCEFNFDDGSKAKITASAGVSVYPSGGGTFDELVSTADQALYRAKKEGRDRACTQETPAD